MSNNYHSISEILKYFMKLQKYATKVLVALNKATTTDEDNVIILLENSDGIEFEYKIPSFNYLNKKVGEVDRQMKNIYLIRDRDENKNIFGQYNVSEPGEIGQINVPEEFFSKPNYFFENMLNPLLYIKVDVSEYLENKAKQVLVRRLIINTDTTEKEEYFNTRFNKRNDLVYDQVIELLAQEGITYKVDEEILNLPPLTLQNSGGFSVLKSYSDIITNDTYSTIRKYKLDKLTYTQKNDKGATNNKILKEGDTLITTKGGTHYRVINVNQELNEVELALVYGYDTIPIGNDVLKIATLLVGDKYFHITIGYDERQIIFLKGIEPFDHTTSYMWGKGVSFNSTDLYIQTDEGKVTLSDYYFSKVNNYAMLWGGIAKESTLPSIFVAKPDPPIVNADNFKVHILNEHVQDKDDIERKKKLVERRDLLEDKKNELQNKIDEDNTIIEEDITLTDEKRTEIKERVSSNLTKKSDTLKEIGTLKTEIKNEHKDYLDKQPAKIKVVVDGAWEHPKPKSTLLTGVQEPTHYKIRVTYLDKNGKPNPIHQIPILKKDNSKEICNVPSNKILITSMSKKILFDPNYFYRSESERRTIDQYLLNNLVPVANQSNSNNMALIDKIINGDIQMVPEKVELSNPTERAINQLPEGIPINVSSGEKVQLEFKTCIKTIDNVVESDWSEPIIVEPDSKLIPKFTSLSTLHDKISYYYELDARNDDVNNLNYQIDLLKAEITSITNVVTPTDYYSKTIKYTLTASDISDKAFRLPQLPSSPSNLIVIPVGGLKGVLNTDYIITDEVTGARIWWNGLGWDGVLEEGDEIELIYLA